MREYEMMYILRPDLDEEAVTQAMDKVSSLVAANGGEVIQAERWGRRRLAYPIKHHVDGLYMLMRFKMDPEATENLERTLRISEDVIRYLVIRLDE